MAVTEQDSALEADGVAELYRRYAIWLTSAVRRRGGGDASEDIVQEAFLRLSRYPIGTLLYPKALLLKVSQNIIRNAVRSAHAAKNRPIANNPLQSSGIVGADQFELLQLKEMVLSLPEAYRDVFILSRFDGMSNAQIAQACNLSVKAVEWRMSRALAFCAERMRD